MADSEKKKRVIKLPSKKRGGKRKISYVNKKGESVDRKGNKTSSSSSGSSSSGSSSSNSLSDAEKKKIIADILKKETDKAVNAVKGGLLKPSSRSRSRSSSSSRNNIFSQNPDVVRAEQERATQEAEFETRLTRYSQTQGAKRSIKEKSTLKKVQEFNAQGTRRLIDAGTVIKNKVTDPFKEKDAQGRVVIRDNQGRVTGSRQTTRQALDQSIRTSTSSGQVWQNIATDFLVDPITLVTAPLGVGGAARTAGGLAKGGVQGVKAANAVKAARAAQAAQKAAQASKGLKAARVAGALGTGGVKAGRNIAVASRATRTGFLASDELILSDEAKRLGVDANKIRGASANLRSAGFQAQDQAAANQVWYKQLAGEINIGFGDKRAFQAGAQNALGSQNQLTVKEQEAAFKAANRQRSGRAFTQLVGDLGISTGSEILGRQTTANVVQAVGGVTTKGAGRTALRTAGISAAGTFGAGVFEGSAQELNQQAAKGQAANVKRAAVMGGLGGASTIFISGGIAGAQTFKELGGKGIVAKAATPLTFAANVADPYELVGDITASGIQRGTTRITGSSPLTAVITRGGTTKNKKGQDVGIFNLGAGKTISDGATFNQAMGFTGTQTQTKQGKKTPFNPMDNFNNIFGGRTNTNTNNRQPSIFTGNYGKQKVSNNPFNLNFGQETPVDNKKPPKGGGRSNPITDDFIDNPIFNDPFIRSESKQQAKTQAQTNTFTTAVNVPTGTFQPRFIPPFPLGAPNLGGSTGVGFGGGRSKKFVNELDFALGSILGTNRTRKAQPRAAKRTKRRKK